jgi:hypothetical protein
MTIRAGGARTLLATVLVMAPACDAGGDGLDRDRRPQAEGDAPSSAVDWGCEHVIPSRVDELDPRWRERATVEVDQTWVGLDAVSAWRPHKEADIAVKLPVTIEGHAGVTVRVPPHERQRVALILSDVPRRGPGNSYRVEDGHQAVRFTPCADRKWSAWVSGLALADPQEIVLNLRVDGAPKPTLVTLGPWPEVPTLDQRSDR